ncbi:hypothetical protein ACFQ1E_16990 [Sphingomonas canadensis]|uniref:Uncharacterized protein n=1 Tax=Sphingomonas canadensis TaxID=1219257 RepID=A0ABW3HA47_9SPHN|nr:hypothetical protein [Sphingomonas canadensis]MCW3837743.1 hypothetical protein [Sphingomonas canadensis]
MTRKADIERARALAAEAIALCDQLGLDLPAAHFQHGLDTMPQGSEIRVVREDRLPWGGSRKRSPKSSPPGES